MWRRCLCVLLLVIGGLVLGQGPAHACSCIADLDPDQEVAQAAMRSDVILTGSAVSVTDSDGRPVRIDSAGGHRRSDHGEYVFTIDVDRVYRGTAAARVELSTTGSSAGCGWEGMPVRRPYVLFLQQQDDGSLTTDLCAGNHPQTPALAASMERAFGAGTPAVTPTPTVVAAEPTPGGTDLRPVWLAALLAGAGLAAALYRWRRRR